MELSSTSTDQFRIISVQGTRIDAAVALEFKDAMRQQTDSGPKQIILDLGNVDFIDSSGLGAIVAALKNVSGGRSMALAGLTPSVDRVFRLTRMDTVFQVFDTLEGAIEGLET